MWWDLGGWGDRDQDRVGCRGILVTAMLGRLSHGPKQLRDDGGGGGCDRNCRPRVLSSSWLWPAPCPRIPPTVFLSFCAASEDEDDDTRAAVGAGISEAYTVLKSEAKDDLARLVRAAACSASCDRFVVTSFAASQGVPVSRMCDLASADDASDLRAPWDLGGGGSGGVRAVSEN